jgi:hypothetical protein
MACLSVVQDGGRAEVVATPIFLMSPVKSLRNDMEVTFEVLKEDAATLTSLVGKKKYYVLDSQKHFWGELRTLEPCESIHAGLAYLRRKPTLRGVLKVFEEATRRQ